MNYLAYVKRSLCLLSLTLALPLAANLSFADKQNGGTSTPSSYRKLILADQPALYWDFTKPASEGGYVSVTADDKQSKPLSALVRGQAPQAAAGPRPSEFPLFDKQNNTTHWHYLHTHVPTAYFLAHQPLLSVYPNHPIQKMCLYLQGHSSCQNFVLRNMTLP